MTITIEQLQAELQKLLDRVAAIEDKQTHDLQPRIQNLESDTDYLRQELVKLQAL